MHLLLVMAAALNVEEATVSDLQHRMEVGQLTSVQLTQAYLERIKAFDGKLKSVLELNPDALKIAAQLDKERKAKGARGPLHGIPVLIKDNLATADRMQTTAGSLALAGLHAHKDADAVKRLRDAGAVILGKTNLSEWANIRSTHSSSGWSGRGGQTRNPYALDRNPCGSSSGTGAAIAASLATVGIGTETDGSIVCPSTHQALVGIKPTVGLISGAGIIPISHSQDTAGPMARTVADAALLLAALAEKPVEYKLDPGALKGARIGIARAKMFGISPQADRVAEKAIEILKAQGAEIVDPADIPHLGEYDDAEQDVLLTELKADLPKYLADYQPDAPFKTLEQLIAWDKEHAAQEMPFFGQELFEQSVKKEGLDSEAYKKSLEACHKLARAEGLDAAFAKYNVDAIVAPTGGPPWLTDLITGDHFTMSSSTPAAVAGYPAITVPAGFDHGLPIGITFMGKAMSEGRLIGLAYAFEQASHARQPPRYAPTAPLK